MSVKMFNIHRKQQLQQNQQNQEIQKRIVIKQTINSMNKQLQKLEEQKQKYIDAGKEAKQRGLTAQYELALSGLRMTLIQERRVYEMKLNFELTSQIKDMTIMTSDFLNGMSILSQDMMRLTGQKDFAQVGRQFQEAMMGAEIQGEQFEELMNSTQSVFTSSFSGTEAEKQELERYIQAEISILLVDMNLMLQIICVACSA